MYLNNPARLENGSVPDPGGGGGAEVVWAVEAVVVRCKWNILVTSSTH